eukprot:3130557-Alexandrium_andersonii.AAC.1
MDGRTDGRTDGQTDRRDTTRWHPSALSSRVQELAFVAEAPPGSAANRQRGTVSYTHLRAHETSAHL